MSVVNGLTIQKDPSLQFRVFGVFRGYKLSALASTRARSAHGFE